MHILFLLVGCLEPTDPPASPPVLGEASIGSNGGIISFEGASAHIPPGALSETVALTLRSIGPGEASDVWALEPAGITFASPITLTLPLYEEGGNTSLEWTTDTTSAVLPSVRGGLAITGSVWSTGTGEAILPTPITDVFELPGPRVDVLLVIDDSCSMETQQAALAQGVNAWIDDLEGRGINYHIGVTTTDMEGSLAGRLHPIPGQTGSRVLTSSTPNIRAALRQMIQAGTAGSPTEAGLAAAYAVLTTEADRPANADFHREGAPIDVLVLSDEEDQSFLPMPELRAAFHEQGIRLNAVVGLQGSSCSAVVDPGSRYSNLANFTGGFTVDLCGDYTDALSLLASDVSTLSTIELSAIPDPSTLVFAHSALPDFSLLDVNSTEEPTLFDVFSEEAGTLTATYLPVD